MTYTRYNVVVVTATGIRSGGSGRPESHPKNIGMKHSVLI
ncbi:hypothetical protein Sros_7776 [Streptosporangium roseum DSM 43021]|uniref:Uncharacterized protein n=1 Tax=Streptosporangium roseum (strain ATCC 12428 / DSM 43021 / JCM 3005 / KCTC 9067 / NCIMB 10171 / NRRL 2505 / NI 9100) TaxID=479432 RepID=D2ASW5_STRRD|nr:hypothetical protein Sros_7776 [Streptosporangium roseum DSM 43021]